MPVDRIPERPSSPFVGRVDRILLRFTVGFAFILSLLLAACATQNTLAQDLAWERWRKCERVGTTGIQEIRPDGQIWFWYNSPTEYTLVRECLAKAAAEQAERRMVAAVPPAAPEVPEGAVGAAMPPVWKRGDEWAYRWESPQGKGTFVWSVDREEALDGVPHYVVVTGTREIYYRESDFAFSLEKLDGAIERRHVPSRLAMVWPLAVGKTWEQTYAEERPQARQTEERFGTWTVESEETVTVPAGTFRTFKIVWRNKRTSAIFYEMWYALEVKQWVKIREYFSYGVRERELIAFKLR